jgi:hypothetical protein
MKKTAIHRFKWFWPWQDDAEEVWLRKMSQQGWHLMHVIVGYYTFQAGPPADYVYRLDYQTPAKKEAANYLQLFQDAGWEHVAAFGNWYYFRKLGRQGDEPQIFTDNESKIAKYNRLLEALAVPAALLVLYMNFVESFVSISGLVFVTFLVILVVIIFGIAIKIDKLKKL